MARPAKFVDGRGQRIRPARVGVIFSPDLAAQVKAHCARKGISVGDWLAALAANELKKPKE